MTFLGRNFYFLIYIYDLEFKRVLYQGGFRVNTLTSNKMMNQMKIVITLTTSLTFIVLTCLYDDLFRVEKFKTFQFYQMSYYVKNQISIQHTTFIRPVLSNTTTVQSILSNF